MTTIAPVNQYLTNKEIIYQPQGIGAKASVLLKLSRTMGLSQSELELISAAGDRILEMLEKAEISKLRLRGNESNYVYKSNNGHSLKAQFTDEKGNIYQLTLRKVKK
ncbi:MAG: hypothetical protein QXD13_00295 [Candidatus Pacearchaeota archaeon]